MFIEAAVKEGLAVGWGRIFLFFCIDVEEEEAACGSMVWCKSALNLLEARFISLPIEDFVWLLLTEDAALDRCIWGLVWGRLVVLGGFGEFLLAIFEEAIR